MDVKLDQNESPNTPKSNLGSTTTNVEHESAVAEKMNYEPTNEVQGQTTTEKLTTVLDLNKSAFHCVLKYLKFNDLIQTRLVCSQWNQMIQTSIHFLTKLVINASIDPDNIRMLSNTSTAWKNVKVKYFDYDNTTTIGNNIQQFSLPDDFCTNLISIEFNQCDIYWTSFKKFIANENLTQLEEIRITKCAIKENTKSSEPSSEEIEESFRRKITRQLSTLILTDSHYINSLTSIIRQFIKFQVTNLTKLKIEFLPYDEPVEIFDANCFTLILAELLKLNSTTLTKLVLNLRSTEILNAFFPTTLSSLETFYEGLRLNTFKLTSPKMESIENSAIVSRNTVRSFLTFMEFLKSQSGTLKSVGFPHFTNLGTHELRRNQLLDCLNSVRLQKLRVPGHIYLKRSFLRTYTGLKHLLIAEKCGIGFASIFNPTKFVYDYRAGITCRHIEDLFISTKLNFESGMLYHFLEKLPNLVNLFLDGCNSIFNDKDLQAIIQYCKKLKSLAIIGCDLITDFGITGIPEKLVQQIFTVSTLYSDVPDFLNRALLSGKLMALESMRICKYSLISLPGLRSLKLTGNSSITDNGIGLAIQFRDLEHLHLPWSEKITDWGISRIGRYNKSLISITLSGGTMATVIALNHVIVGHERLQRNLCRVLRIIEDSAKSTEASGNELESKSTNIICEPKPEHSQLLQPLQQQATTAQDFEVNGSHLRINSGTENAANIEIETETHSTDEVANEIISPEENNEDLEPEVT